MNISPLSIEDIRRDHQEFLYFYANKDAREQLLTRGHDLATNIGAISIEGFLQQDALSDLDMSWRRMQGASGKLLWAPCLTGMLGLMVDLSRLYVGQNKMHEVHATIKHLHFSPEDPKHNTLVPPHHDWKDGNAVLFNWDVTGPQIYRIGQNRLRIASNQLVVLKGDSTYLPLHQAFGTVVHAVESPEEISYDDLKHLERDRILVFCDGEPTEVTMLPPEVV